jgi:hypothetical protein
MSNNNLELPSLSDDLNQLARHDAFARFLQEVDRLKELAQDEMFAAGTEQLQQIAGKILAYNEILKNSDAQRVMAMHSQFLR